MFNICNFLSNSLQALTTVAPGVHQSIKALAEEPNTDVVIFSGADKGKLEETFGDLPVWLAAENGMYLRTSVPHEDEEVTQTAS